MSSSELSRVKERSKCRKQLNEIYNEATKTYVIHYSCESFYAPDGQSPLANSTRVTSIAVRNLKNGQTKIWSIHKSAELKGKSEELSKLIKANAPLTNQENEAGAQQTKTTIRINKLLNTLELDMLKGYFSFLSHHDHYMYIHWNMRDDNYGFSALEHRYRVLGGDSITVLDDNNKFDLARELIKLFGKRYASHTSPKGRRGRLMTVVELNRISDTDALQGAEEAAAFVNGEFIKLQQSTLRKVDMLSNIFDRAHDKSLKTNASFSDKHGIHPIALIEVIRNKPIVIGILFLLGAFTTIIKFKDSILSFFY